MTRGLFALTMMLLFINTGVAQQPEVYGDLSTGVAMGWWVYTLGTGSGVDRTDYEPKITFEGDVLVKFKRFGIGIGIGYSMLFDNSMEAFEDTRARRRKYQIADNYVQFFHYQLLLEYDVYSNARYVLSPQVRLGAFSIDTTHPQKDNFDKKTLFEFGVVNQFSLSQSLWFTIRPFYQSKMISVQEERLPGENHDVLSLGLSLGLRYHF